MLVLIHTLMSLSSFGKFLITFCMISQVVIGGSIVDFIAMVKEPEIKVSIINDLYITFSFNFMAYFSHNLLRRYGNCLGAFASYFALERRFGYLLLFGFFFFFFQILHVSFYMCYAAVKTVLSLLLLGQICCLHVACNSWRSQFQSFSVKLKAFRAC